MKRMLITLIFATLFSTGQVQAQNKKLIDYVNSLPFRDYIILSDSQAEALKPLLPKTKYYSEAKIVLKKSDYVSHDLIVVEIADMLMIPGASTAIVHFFRSDGEELNQVIFNIGYRQHFGTIHVRKCPDLPELLMEIRTGSWGQDGVVLSHFQYQAEWVPREADYSVRQTYAFQNNSVKLVRLTRGDGTPLPNPYDVRHYTYGPLCNYNYEQLLRLVKSTFEVDQLHVLTWLNGKHFTGDMRNRPEHYSEPTDSINAFQRARNSRDVFNLLKQRSKSSNYWISSMASYLKYEFEQPLKTYLE